MNDDSAPMPLEHGDQRFDLIDVQLKAGRERMTALEVGQKAINVAIAENTEMTKSIHDLLVVGRLGTAAIKWLGAIAAACMAVWFALYAVLHGGVTPK